MTAISPRDNGDLTDYSWLGSDASLIAELASTYCLEWRIHTGERVPLSSIEEVELETGFTLPPSLRAFYIAHNGFALAMFSDSEELGTIKVLTLSQILSKRRDNEIAEEPVPPTLLAVVQLTADQLLLDLSNCSGITEAPLFYGSHEVGPPIWLENLVAPSFGEWIRSLFRMIILDRRDPFLNSPMSDSAQPPEYFSRLASDARIRGSRSESWSYGLAAITRRLDDVDGFAADLDALRSIPDSSASDLFLIRLFERILDCNLKDERKIVRERLRVGYKKLAAPIEDLPSSGVKSGAMPQLRKFAEVFESVMFSNGRRFEEPYSAFFRNFTLYSRAVPFQNLSVLGETETELRRRYPDYEIIGLRGVAWTNSAYDIILISKLNQSIASASYRPETTNGFTRSLLVGDLKTVADTLDIFLDQELSA